MEKKRKLKKRMSKVKYTKNQKLLKERKMRKKHTKSNKTQQEKSEFIKIST